MIKLNFRFTRDYSWVNIYVAKLNKDLHKAGKLVAEAIADRIRRNILEGKRYDGKNVAKILPSTIRKKGGDTRPLVHTFTLYKSIDVKELPSSYKVHVKALKGRTGSGTPRDKVAAILQRGAPHIKERPFFGTTKKFISSLDKRIQNILDA